MYPLGVETRDGRRVTPRIFGGLPVALGFACPPRLARGAARRASIIVRGDVSLTR